MRHRLHKGRASCRKWFDTGCSFEMNSKTYLAGAALLLGLVLCAQRANGEHLGVTVAVPDSERWMYLGKFAYQYAAPEHQKDPNYQGTFSYKVHGSPVLSSDLKLVLYAESNWNHAKNLLNANCSSGLITPPAAVVLPMEHRPEYTTPTFATVHPQYMYFVLTACGSDPIPDMEMDMRFTNPGGYFYAEFSVDEWGIFQTYLGCAVLLLLITITYIYKLQDFNAQRTLHFMVKVYTFALLMHLIGNMCEVFHLAVYADNGVGIPVLSGFADLFIITSYIVFMVVLFLMARGVAISDVTVPFTDTERYIFIVALVVTAGAYVGRIVMSASESQTVTYAYQRAPNVILCAMQILLFVWYWWSIRQTRAREVSPEKTKMYGFLLFFYTYWFLLPPAITFISPLLNAWIRDAAVSITTNIAQTLALMVMAAFLWPNKAQKLMAAPGNAQRYGNLAYNEL